MLNQRRIALGEGERTFADASQSLRQWTQFRLGWVEPWPREVPIERGQCVAVIARLLGGWWLNACRIVYVVNQQGPIHRFGFANGTLPAHVGIGEERFLIEWDRKSDAVTYEIYSFSRPNRLIARLGYPYMRHVQKRFARDSGAAMVKSLSTALK